jgi:hypothetical protein
MWDGSHLISVGTAENSGIANAYMSDSGSGTVNVNSTADTWSLSGSGNTYTVRNNRTSNYLDVSGGNLVPSPLSAGTPTVWTFTLPVMAPHSAVYAGEWASLTTVDGIWTLSGASDSQGDQTVYLGVIATSLLATQLQLANGTIYGYSLNTKTWWIWRNKAWVQLTANSPDGLVIYAGPVSDYPDTNSFFLTTSEGTWTWGSTATSTGDYPTQLNGTANGDAVKMQITNGILYALNAEGNWYARNNGNWVLIGTTAPVEGATPTPAVITFVGAKATLPDTAPANTVIATAHVTMSDGSSNFGGTLTTSNASFFAISGMNIVTAQALTSANDGTQSTVITASQGSQSASMELSI